MSRDEKMQTSPPDDAAIDELVRRGDAYFAQGDSQKALAHFQLAMTHRPDEAEYAYRIGLVSLRLGDPVSAKQHFEQAILLKPGFAHAHCELGRVLLAIGNIERAIQHTRRAVDLEPGDPSLAIALASILEADRQPGPARIIVDQLIQAGHESTDLAMVYARLSARGNSSADALALIDRLLQRMPSITDREKSALHFSAANLLDSLGRYDEAFGHAASANALRGAVYDATQTAASFQGFIDYFTRERLARFPRPQTPSDLPVFIVGMPRSGTSLVEQILSSHPAIHGAGELNWIARTFDAAVQTGARGFGPSLESLGNLSIPELEMLASQYVGHLGSRQPSARFITDKMPTNFIYLGLIAILFPQAHIIHCRREPLDTCLSCLMTDFAAGYEFSFSLPGVGHFYRQYDRIMSHWKSVIDLPMLEVNYAEVVSDIEGQSRRMLTFLGLPWDESCLQFHENKRFVGTASHAQVRRPVYQSSVGRWKNYEKHLPPLRTALDGD